MQKRAKFARCRYLDINVYLLTLSLAIGAVPVRVTLSGRAECSGEAQVSIERNGPHGSIAGHRAVVGWVRFANRA